MADYAQACITIGGKISEADLPRLIEAITNDGAGPGYGEAFDDLPAALRAGAAVELFDDQAKWGRFEHIEDLCHTLGLTYRKWNEAKWDMIEEIIICRPQGNESYCAVSGLPVFHRSDLSRFASIALAQAELQRVADFQPPPLEII